MIQHIEKLLIKGSTICYPHNNDIRVENYLGTKFNGEWLDPWVFLSLYKTQFKLTILSITFEALLDYQQSDYQEEKSCIPQGSEKGVKGKKNKDGKLGGWGKKKTGKEKGKQEEWCGRRKDCKEKKTQTSI